MDAGDLNSGLHVWLASALPTEASLQPHAFWGGGRAEFCFVVSACLGLVILLS